MTEFTKYCREYLDQAPYGLLIFDKKGKILEANPEACHISGLSRKKILSRSLSALFSEEPGQDASEFFNRLIEDDTSTGIINYNKPECSECFLRIDAVKVKDNKYLAFVIDVTEDVKNRRDLKTRLRLERIISTFSSSLTIVDSDNIDEVINKAFRMLGKETGVDRIYFFLYSDDLVYSSNLYEWCSEGTAPEIDKLQNIKSSDIPWWTLRMKENQPVMFENINDFPEDASVEKAILLEQNIKSIVIIPAFSNGSLKGFFGFDSVKSSRKWTDQDLYLLRMAGNALCNSIMRIKKQEEQSRLEETISSVQRLDSIGKLAGGVAHDFNNIMQIIAGYTELALGSDNKYVKKYLEEIKKASEKASGLTAQLLAFARKQHVSPRSIDLNKAVLKTVNLVEGIINPEINLEFKPADDLWHVVIDPSQVDQLVTNLIFNSSDSISGRGRIIVETYNTVVDDSYCRNHPYFSPGKFAVLAVSDTGCGMDDKTKAHIFEPFFSTKDNSGAGLGLSTVYGIVKQNDGYIIVYSEEEIGSTFKVYLKKDKSSLPEFSGQHEEAGAAFVTSKKILVVEDEDSILTLISKVLEKSDYYVLTAENGQDALSEIEENSPELDLLITDVVMPGMNGHELSDKVKEYYPDIKTIFISGYTANIIADRGILDKGINFLQKPFSVKQLKEKVAEVLDSAEE